MLAARRHSLPPPLPGFENINRFWDKTHDCPAAKIRPGEYYVTARKDELITTTLGSCVSACIRDRIFGIGGMNHFMLPLSEDGQWNGGGDLATRYGNYAMEHLINDILKHGGHRSHLEAKIFGGGRVLDGHTDVGTTNIAFVREYLATEGIPLLAEDVGDIHPRKVVFFPADGRVRVKRIKHLHNDTIARRERSYRNQLEEKPIEGSIELF